MTHEEMVYFMRTIISLYREQSGVSVEDMFSRYSHSMILNEDQAEFIQDLDISMAQG